VTDPFLSRRAFLGASVAAGAASVARRAPLWTPWTPAQGAPAIVTAERLRPVLPGGVQAGDVLGDRAVVWSRADRAARWFVEWDTSDRFRTPRRLEGPAARAEAAFTTHLDLTGLPAGETIAWRARYESVDAPGAFSDWTTGHFRTPSRRGDRPVRVAWSGDMVGQGWGIDASRGGLRIYDALRRAEPDLFIHSGDNIYADQPLVAEVPLDDGTVWRNLVTEAKSRPAQSLDDFRGNFAYNQLDPHAQAFGASVPVVAQWDDHEVVDNWFWELTMERDARYTEKQVRVLAERARQALFEFLPMRRHPSEPHRVYRSFAHGPLLDVFVVDLRSYRDANSNNRQPAGAPGGAIFGATQLGWLAAALKGSRATWKVVACDMPVGLVVPDRRRNNEPNFEGIANADDGAPLGREHEVAALLRGLRQGGVKNVVWVTADVHYCAAHHYSPDRAAFTDFDPFWEFVAGPMHAGTFGPNALDRTFGPEVRFASPAPKPNRPPSDNLQFYGTLDIDPRTKALTAALWDVTGKRLWSTELAPG
jgi:alkaline phosphatase D